MAKHSMRFRIYSVDFLRRWFGQCPDELDKRLSAFHTHGLEIFGLFRCIVGFSRAPVAHVVVCECANFWGKFASSVLKEESRYALFRGCA